jgi:hypothetical protein
MLDAQNAAAILQLISDSKSTLSEFLCFIFEDRNLDGHPAVQDTIDNIKPFLSTLLDHRGLHNPMLQWALAVTNRDHAQSIQQLTRTSEGWHFAASNASADQISDFQLEEMAQQIENTAPRLWKTVTALLSADPKQMRRRSRQDLTDEAEAMRVDSDVLEEEDDTEFWEDIVGGEADSPDAATHSEDHPHRAKTAQQRERILIGVCGHEALLENMLIDIPSEGDLYH